MTPRTGKLYTTITEEMAAANRKLLTRITGMSEEQLFWYRHELGMAFLRQQCGKDAAGVTYLSGERFFWSWWIDLWDERDEMFIATHELRESAATAMRRADNVFGAYRYQNGQAQFSELLNKSFSHLMHSTMPYWRSRVSTQIPETV